METARRIPLQDLPLEQFFTSGIATGSKTPQNHKRPLSPSRTTPFNPAKRRVLDAEGIPLSNNVVKPSSHPVPFMLFNMHTVTPSRPSRLGNGAVRNYGSSQGTSSPLSSQRCSPSRESYPRPTIESSTNPQSRHYPGFDIFRDGELRRGSPVRRTPQPPASHAQVDGPEGDKENVPLRRKAKKPSSKKRSVTGLDSFSASSLSASVQTSKVARPGRTPFSARHALR